jgi:hypothetical protein
LAANSPLAGYTVSSYANLYGRIPTGVLTDAERQEIVRAYQWWSSAFELDVRIVFAQALIETGGFRFGKLVQPSQKNPCGLGATGSGVPGASFKTWEDGVIAHCAHLALYTHLDHICPQCSLTSDPRHSEHRTFQIEHGRALVLSDLDGVWAVPGIGYGQSIASAWNRGI